MKKRLLALALLLPSFAWAQIIPPLPVTLTNGTLADANQVMSDFNTIVSGVNTNGAKNGINNDITALGALTTPLTPVQGGSSVYSGADSGSANAFVVAAPVPINFTLRSGNVVNFIPSFTNTGPSTLATAGTTATALLRQTAAGLQPLAGGEIFTGQIASAIYDGTQYELINSAVTANVQPCTAIDYAGITVPTGYLAEDGSAKSRTTFAALFACLSNLGVAATTVSTSTTVTLGAPLATSVGWYVGGSNVTCNSTITTVSDSTHIIISNAAGSSGATTLTIGPNPQGDCSTTFNVPDLRGRATAMIDLSGAVLTSTTCTNATSIGSLCGTETKTLVTGNLPPYTPTTSTVSLGSFEGGAGPLNSGNTRLVFTGPGGDQNLAYSTFQTVAPSVTMNAQGGTSTPLSAIQPIALVTKAIKF